MREGHAKLAREWGEWSAPDSATKSEKVADDVGKAAESNETSATADDLATGLSSVKLDDAPATPSKIMREEPSRPEASESAPAADKRAAL